MDGLVLIFGLFDMCVDLRKRRKVGKANKSLDLNAPLQHQTACSHTSNEPNEAGDFVGGEDSQIAKTEEVRACTVWLHCDVSA